MTEPSTFTLKGDLAYVYQYTYNSVVGDSDVNESTATTKTVTFNRGYLSVGATETVTWTVNLGGVEVKSDGSTDLNISACCSNANEVNDPTSNDTCTACTGN